MQYYLLILERGTKGRVGQKTCCSAFGKNCHQGIPCFKVCFLSHKSATAPSCFYSLQGSFHLYTASVGPVLDVEPKRNTCLQVLCKTTSLFFAKQTSKASFLLKQEKQLQLQVLFSSELSCGPQFLSWSHQLFCQKALLQRRIILQSGPLGHWHSYLHRNSMFWKFDCSNPCYLVEKDTWILRR